jgi:hypothetical protein
MSDVVAEKVSADSKYKVVILQRKDGLYEIVTFRWTREIIPGEGQVAAFWEPVAQASLTDTFSNAEKLAADELVAWSGETENKT